MNRLLTLILFFSVANVFAAAAVVETSKIESVKVHGVNLGMSADQAFSVLTDAGFKAGPIKQFTEWTGEGLELVRGDGQGPEGEARLLIVRRDGVIIRISGTFIRTRGERFNPESEISQLQEALGLASDDTRCRVAPSGSGICEAKDHDDPNQAQTSLTISVTPIMKQSVVLRREALRLQ